MHGAELVAGTTAVPLIVIAVVQRSRAGQVQRDPQRIFTEAQRQAIFNRAGSRCEHVSAFGFRCRTKPSHADHIQPWSKGGATTLANGQALCVQHNLSKGSRVPSLWYVHRLERRRRSYFPAGAPTAIERR